MVISVAGDRQVAGGGSGPVQGTFLAAVKPLFRTVVKDLMGRQKPRPLGKVLAYRSPTPTPPPPSDGAAHLPTAHCFTRSEAGT